MPKSLRTIASNVAPETLEAIARATVKRLRLRTPPTVERIALSIGAELRRWPDEGRAGAFVDLLRRVIYLPDREFRRGGRELRWTVAHEASHLLLRDAHLDAQDEGAADFLADALLVPGARLERDIEAGTPAAALHANYTGAPRTTIRRRVAFVRRLLANGAAS